MAAYNGTGKLVSELNGTVIDLNEARNNRDKLKHDNTEGEFFEVKNEDAPVGDGVISFNKLYPLSSSILEDTKLHSLTKEALILIDNSLEYLRDEDFINSDNNIQHLYMLLPDLFHYRFIGDGYGYLVLAIFHSLQNKNGQPLNIEEIESIRLCMYRCKEEPFMSFERAVEYSEHLENAGLMPESLDIQNFTFLCDV